MLLSATQPLDWAATFGWSFEGMSSPPAGTAGRTTPPLQTEPRAGKEPVRTKRKKPNRRQRQQQRERRAAEQEWRHAFPPDVAGLLAGACLPLRPF